MREDRLEQDEKEWWNKIQLEGKDRVGEDFIRWDVILGERGLIGRYEVDQQ